MQTVDVFLLVVVGFHYSTLVFVALSNGPYSLGGRIGTDTIDSIDSIDTLLIGVLDVDGWKDRFNVKNIAHSTRLQLVISFFG